MKRLMMLLAAAVLVAAPVFAQSKAADKPDKTMTATGKVSAVAADSVTVKGKDAEWTFGVDKATTVVAKGGSHKMAALNADKKPTVITEFVSVGDDVSVKYHDMGATKHAATVTVRRPEKK
jgi:type 1 fimbria pilin